MKKHVQGVKEITATISIKIDEQNQMKVTYLDLTDAIKKMIKKDE